MPECPLTVTVEFVDERQADAVYSWLQYVSYLVREQIHGEKQYGIYCDTEFLSNAQFEYRALKVAMEAFAEHGALPFQGVDKRKAAHSG